MPTHLAARSARRLAAGAILALSPVPALAQQPAENATPNIPVERYTLKNGMTVLLSLDKSTPVVAVDLWYHVGSKNEKPGRTGFAHLF